MYRPGFELKSPIPFPMTIIVTLSAPPNSKSIYIYIYIYIYIIKLHFALSFSKDFFDRWLYTIFLTLLSFYTLFMFQSARFLSFIRWLRSVWSPFSPCIIIRVIKTIRTIVLLRPARILRRILERLAVT